MEAGSLNCVPPNQTEIKYSIRLEIWYRYNNCKLYDINNVTTILLAMIMTLIILPNDIHIRIYYDDDDIAIIVMIYLSRIGRICEKKFAWF